MNISPYHRIEILMELAPEVMKDCDDFGSITFSLVNLIERLKGNGVLNVHLIDHDEVSKEEFDSLRYLIVDEHGGI